MKQLLLAIFLTLLALHIPAAQAQNTSLPVTQTVGNGSNISYFVINFNDGLNNSNNPASNYLFAYRWDSNANPTGETVLTALDQFTTPRLQVNQTYYSSFNAYFVNGFTYLTHSQIGYYNSGTDQASWAYWVQDGGTWTQPQAYGVSGRSLFNGSYDGWTFHVGSGSAPAPVTALAAPEPAPVSVLALGVGGVVLFTVRRKRRAGRFS